MKPTMAQLVALAEQEAIAQGMNPAVFKAILVAENTGSGEYNPAQTVDPKTTSEKQAFGVSQIIPSTWDALVRSGHIPAGTDRNSVQGQVRGMVSAVREKMSHVGDDPDLIAVAYHSGPTEAKRFRDSGKDESILGPRTRDYLRKVRKQVGPEISGHNTDAMSNVLSRTDESFVRSNEILKAMQGVTSDFRRDGNQAISAAEAQGEAEAASARARGAGQVQKMDFMQNLLSSMGLDANAPSGEFQRNREIAAQATAQVQALQPQIQALRSVSFADDPLGWVKAQFQLEGVVGKHNAAAKVYNDNMAIISKNQEVAARQAQLQTGVSTDSVTQAAAADAQARLAEAQLKAFSIKNSVKQAELSALSMEQAQLDRQFSQTLREEELADRRQIKADRRTEEQKQAALLQGVNEFRARLDLAPFTAEQFKVLPAAQKDKMLELSSRPGAGVADSPGASIVAMSDLGALTNFREKMSVHGKTFFDQYVRRAQEQISAQKVTNPKMKDDEAFVSAANKMVLGWREQQKTQDYSSLPPDHPLAMNANLFAQAPELATNSLAKHVRDLPNAGSGMSPKDVLAQAIAQIRTGTPASQVAKEVRDFFEFGMKHQGASYRLPALNIDPRNPVTGQLDFPVKGNIFGLMDRFFDPRKAVVDKPIDLTNEAAVTNFLILNTISGSGGNMPGSMAAGYRPNIGEMLAPKKAGQ